MSRAAQAPLQRLIELRQRELDRRQAELAAKEQMRQRQQAMVQRLEQLGRDVGASVSGTGTAALAANSAGYKQQLLEWTVQQRQDLALHEADMAAQRQQMLAVARSREAYEQLQQRRHEALRLAASRSEQKRQDDIAGQVWLRGEGHAPV